MAGAPKGSKNAQKLKTPDLKQEAYRQYCAHIASGIPQDAWCFDHPQLTLTWETMEKYIREDPINFDPLKKQLARAESYKHWFGVLSDSAKGINEKASTASLQMIMRNKFKWDKQQHITHEFQPEARRLLEKWEND